MIQKIMSFTIMARVLIKLIKLVNKLQYLRMKALHIMYKVVEMYVKKYVIRIKRIVKSNVKKVFVVIQLLIFLNLIQLNQKRCLVAGISSSFIALLPIYLALSTIDWISVACLRMRLRLAAAFRRSSMHSAK